MQKTIIASLIGLAIQSSAFAAENLNLEEVTVKANRFERKDTETTYASEIHTAEQIEASGATTLYDFLAQQTSLNVLSSFGNKLTPSINLRGFGNENGHQNVVITLDGQRLNNIDSSSQLLGAIPLGNIERIEISKGSGSVIYGDGATAGAIQIYTKNKSGVTASTSLGNFGQKNSYINAGFSEQYIDLSVSLAHDSLDGFSKKDASGHRDQSTSNTQNVKLAIKPTDKLRLIAEGTSSRNDIRYVSPLTRAQFNDDPRNVGLNFLGNPSTYTQQSLDTDQWKIGASYQITDTIKLSATHFREDKTSAFPSFVSKYDYASNDIALSYNNDIISAIIGYQDFDGDRKSTSNTTTKDNRALFIHSEYRPTWLDENLTLSAGARQERVNYQFSPTTGSNLKDSENLDAWDIGANYRFNTELSAFANYNQSFQAPDIDRFFVQDFSLFPVVTTNFNGFIDPAKVKTLNIGVNHLTDKNRLKISVFHANLKDEIYLLQPNAFTFINTNLDKSHKFGLEIQDYFKLNDQLSASVIYNYTRAKIDREIESGVRLNGNDLPGVPKHTVVANLNYQFVNNIGLNVNHTWRSKAFAFNDLQNNFEQKQDHYNSTNVALNYQYKNLNFFAAVNNLFEVENSIQVADDSIYPVDFVRTWRMGMRADF
ncbi:MAG: TonB-dependent receptor [Methylotenera sp.]|nr:TonB-dependent receptor [Methylotenera sp.]